MLTIRTANREDVHILYSMLRESAAAQGAEHQLCVDPDSLLEDGFGPQPRFHALLAEWDHKPAGLALWFFNYSTWTSRNGLYLEDLYVSPEFRGKGVARALMARLARVAVEAGCARFHWLVLRDNALAIRFYESIGAAGMQDWLYMRLPAADLERVAAQA